MWKYTDRLARDASRLLQKLTNEQRKTIINKMASNLTDYSKDVLQANRLDLEKAKKDGWWSHGHCC